MIRAKNIYKLINPWEVCRRKEIKSKIYKYSEDYQNTNLELKYIN